MHLIYKYLMPFGYVCKLLKFNIDSALNGANLGGVLGESLGVFASIIQM